MDPLAEMQDRLPPFSRLLGIRLLSLAPDRVTAEMPVRDDLCTTPAIAHGGSLMAFADTIGEIAITGSVIRIDLVSLSPTNRDDKGQPRPEFRQRVVMPVEGFMRSFGLMSQVVQQLEKSGVIKKVDAAQVEAATKAAPASPNFS